MTQWRSCPAVAIRWTTPSAKYDNTWQDREDRLQKPQDLTMEWNANGSRVIFGPRSEVA